jgi:hypothetical protein
MRISFIAAMMVATTGVACSARLGLQGLSPGLPPVRAVQHAAAISANTFGDLSERSMVRVLPDGAALLNVPAEFKVFRFDSNLSSATVVLDSTQVTSPSFIFNCLLSFTGDSSVFATANSPDAGRIAPVRDPGWSFQVLNAHGVIVRTIPLPASYEPHCPGTAVGSRATSVIYRAPHLVRADDVQRVDSLPIVRLDLPTSRFDTVAWVEFEAHGRSRDVDSVGANGRRYLERTTPAFKLADEWAVTSDGAIAVLRWRDYRVDWTFADGTRGTTRETPWPWRRLAFEEKQRIVDSLGRVRARDLAEATRYMWEQQRGSFVMMGRIAPAAETPDFAPPFKGDHEYARTDDRGDIWVRSLPTSPVGAGTLYDVIDRNGRMVDRVLFAPDRVLVGVAGGNAYLVAGRLGAMRLERVVVGRRAH